MISVIISVYNVAPYIEKCINSIRNQSYSDLEIIAVDDGSTDESGKLCDQLAEADSRIVVIHKENGGSSSARNAGLDAAKGEFVAFVDADDYIESNMYEEMLEELKCSGASLVNSGIIVTNMDGEEKVVTCQKRKVYSKEEALFDFFAREGNVSSSVCDKLFRRELFDRKIRFNDNIIHEDTEAIPRLLDASERIVVMDKAFYHYIKRKNSKTTSRYFSLKGYYFLDSVKDYERMCKEKYPRILPYFYYYELITNYEMFLYLMSCADYKKYKIQGLSLRFRMIKGMINCTKWEVIKKEYDNLLKEILIIGIFGLTLASHIFRLIRKLPGRK